MERKDAPLEDDVKSFPLAPLLALVSKRSTTQSYGPMGEVVGFMTGNDMDIMNTPIGMMIFSNNEEAIGIALLKQYPIFNKLKDEYTSFCETDLPQCPNPSDVWTAIDTWLEAKTAELPPDLQKGFPVKKLDVVATKPHRKTDAEIVRMVAQFKPPKDASLN